MKSVPPQLSNSQCVLVTSSDTLVSSSDALVTSLIVEVFLQPMSIRRDAGQESAGVPQPPLFWFAG